MEWDFGAVEHFVKMSVVAVDEEEKGGQGKKKERKRGAGGGGCNDGGRREMGPTHTRGNDSGGIFVKFRVFNFGKTLVLLGC